MVDKKSVKPVIPTPELTPAERREQLILGRIGSYVGWSFVEYVDIPDGSPSIVCDITHIPLRHGVKISREGITKIVGIGAAKKYTDVKLPKRVKSVGLPKSSGGWLNGSSSTDGDEFAH